MRKGKHPPRARLGLSTAIAALLSGLSAPALAVRVDYTIDAGIEHNDNVGLAEDDPISQNILRAGLGFAVLQEGDSVRAALDGRMEYRNYPERFADQLEGSLDGHLDWMLVPRRLAFNVDDSLSVQPVNALVPDAPGNRQQINVFSAGPTLLLGSGGATTGAVELRYIRSDAEETEEFNSDRVHLGVSATRQLAPTRSASATVQAQEVDFDEPLLADYQRRDAYVSYSRQGARAGLDIDLGYSQLDYEDRPDRSAPLLRAELGWQASARSHFALVGWNQYSDTASAALDAIDAGVEVPDMLPIGSVVVGASQYKEQRLTLEYTYDGARIEVGIAPYVYRARYVEDDEYDQDGRGVRIDLSRHLTPTLDFGAFLDHERIEYRTLVRDVRMSRVGLFLQKELSRHWHLRLDWDGYRHQTEPLGRDIERRTVYLSIVYSSY